MGNVIPKTLEKSQNPPQDEELEELTFTCEICIEPITLPVTKFKKSNRWGHPFCTDSIIKYIEVKLEDNISDIKCPATTCTHSLDQVSCRPKLTQELYNKWCDVLCESTVSRFDKVFCPNIECSEMILNECGDCSLKKCVCPNCKKPFCYKCKVPWHAGYSCEQSGDTRDENDVVFGIVCEKKGWKSCPKCSHCVELTHGCNIVKCRCGNRFCYQCGKVSCYHRCIEEAVNWFVATGFLFILLAVIAGLVFGLGYGAYRVILFLLALY